MRRLGRLNSVYNVTYIQASLCEVSVLKRLAYCLVDNPDLLHMVAARIQTDSLNQKVPVASNAKRSKAQCNLYLNAGRQADRQTELGSQSLPLQ